MSQKARPKALPLPSDLYSPDQLGIIMLELHNYTSKLQKLALKAQVAGDKKDEALPATSALLAELLQATGMQPDDTAELETLLNDLESIRASAPVAHLTLTALPNRTIKRELIEWFRAHIHPHAMITFAIRTDIGGGMLLRAGSRVYDLSFREQLLQHKAIIPKLVRK